MLLLLTSLDTLRSIFSRRRVSVDPIGRGAALVLFVLSTFFCLEDVTVRFDESVVAITLFRALNVCEILFGVRLESNIRFVNEGRIEDRTF